MASTYHPHLVPVLNKEESFTCTPLWAFMASSRINFSLTVTLYLIKSLLHQFVDIDSTFIIEAVNGGKGGFCLLPNYRT